MTQIMGSITESVFVLRRIAGLARAWPYFWLAILIIIVMVLHFSAVMNPPEYVFDESWYASDASLILEGKGSFIPQHPPLGRMIIAGGIAIFGDNPLGWRFFSILFGAVGLVLFYLVCTQLKIPEKPAFLATFFLSIENLSFIQSSIAMLDVFSVTLMLAAFYAFLKNRWYLSGFLIGVSALAKFTGIFAIAVIGLYWLVTHRKSTLRLGLSFLLTPLTYLAGLTGLLFIIWGKFLNPITETITMLQLNSYSTFAVIESSMLSRPWEWLFGYKIITYYPDPHYIAAISSTIWALAVPAMLYMAFRAYKGNHAAAFSAAWFAGCYLLWIPISLITQRTSYIFYFYPVIGAVSAAIAVLLADISTLTARYSSWVFKFLARWAIPLYILMHIACFVFLAPAPSTVKFIAGVAMYVLMRCAMSTEEVVTGNKEQMAAA